MSILECRQAAVDYLKATTVPVLDFWRDMADDWTGATDCIPPGWAQSTTSQYLAILRRVGAVETKREGRRVFYRPAPAFRLHMLEARRIVVDASQAESERDA